MSGHPGPIAARRVLLTHCHDGKEIAQALLLCMVGGTVSGKWLNYDPVAPSPARVRCLSI